MSYSALDLLRFSMFAKADRNKGMDAIELIHKFNKEFDKKNFKNMDIDIIEKFNKNYWK